MMPQQKKRRVAKQEGMQIIDGFLRKVLEIPMNELSEVEVESKVEELRSQVKRTDNMYVKELLVK